MSVVVDEKHFARSAALKVELDIAGGTTNPAWELGARESSELESILANATSSSVEMDPPAHGYRGFLLHRAQPVRIFRGQIVPHLTVAPRQWAKLGAQLDLWLLETGRLSLAADVYENVLNTLFP